MRKLRYLLGNLSLLNLLLAAALIFSMKYMASPFLHVSTKVSLPQVKHAAAEDPFKIDKAEEKSPSPSDYMVIAEQNLFHPERIIPVPKVEAPPLPKPEFVLFGTLVTDSLQLAYMDDKKADGKPKGPQDKKKQTAVRLGDSLSGFVLKEVGKDHVLMQRGDERITVSLNEAKVREIPGPAAPPAGTPVAQTPGQPPVQPGVAARQAGAAVSLPANPQARANEAAIRARRFRRPIRSSSYSE